MPASPHYAGNSLAADSSSSTRRWLLLGVLLVAGALLVVVAERATACAPARGGNFGACARLEGDAARACYSREVGRELAAVGGSGAPRSLRGAGGRGEVTFTSRRRGTPPLLCDLHARVGVVDPQVPSWLGWTEPLALPLMSRRPFLLAGWRRSC